MHIVDFLEEFGKMEDRGTPIGSGLYAHVFDSDMPGIVLKYGHNITDAWLLYALNVMAAEEHKLWMPKIKALVYDLNQKKFYAAIEKLEEQGIRSTSSSICKCFTRMRKRGVAYHIAKEISNMMNNIQEDAEKCGMDLHFDAHSGNWMKRGRNFVLTDPLSNESYRDSLIELYVRNMVIEASKYDDRIKVIGL